MNEHRTVDITSAIDNHFKASKMTSVTQARTGVDEFLGSELASSIEQNHATMRLANEFDQLREYAAK